MTTTTVNNSKFNINELNEDKLKMIDQNNRPKDLPSLSSNHIITSPTNSNSNAVWNTDSWADGDFEPLEEHSGEGKYSIKFVMFIQLIYVFCISQMEQATPN